MAGAGRNADVPPARCHARSCWLQTALSPGWLIATAWNVVTWLVTADLAGCYSHACGLFLRGWRLFVLCSLDRIPRLAPGNPCFESCSSVPDGSLFQCCRGLQLTKASSSHHDATSIASSCRPAATFHAASQPLGDHLQATRHHRIATMRALFIHPVATNDLHRSCHEGILPASR